MSNHTCQRCGLESRCPSGNWSDRHPAAAVALAAFTVMFSLVVVVGHPWLLIVAAVGAVVYFVDREVRRRRALAARADWEFRRLMEQPVIEPGPKPRPRGASHFAMTVVVMAMGSALTLALTPLAQADPAGNGICRLLAAGNTPSTLESSVTVRQVLGPDATAADARVYIRSVVAGQCPQYLWRW